MKKLVLTIGMLCAVEMLAVGAGYISLSSNSYIQGGTNTVVVAGTNALACYVPQASTNLYQMPGATVNTNYYPSLEIVPGNNINPMRYVGLQFICTGTNGSVVTVALSASADNVHWITNWNRFSVTCNGTGLALGTPVQVLTNIDTYAFPYLALQSIECPNGVATNMFLIPVGKSGW